MTEAVQKETTDTTASPITVTAEAAERLRAEMDRRDGEISALRLMVQPGGCAGLQYALAFARGEPNELESTLESNGVTLYIETQVLELVEGSQIEWVDNLIGGGFRVTNPNAQSSCGCGKSFC